MHSYTGIYKHLPVYADIVYTDRCIFIFIAQHFSSICRCFSSWCAAILHTSQNPERFPGFHLPPAALACNRIGISVASMRRGTRDPTYNAAKAATLGPFDNQLDRFNPVATPVVSERTQSRASPTFLLDSWFLAVQVLRISRVSCNSIQTLSVHSMSGLR